MAEAEVLGYEQLVSFDNDLTKRLSDVSEIKLVKPIELWESLDISPGSKIETTPSKFKSTDQHWWLW